MPNIFDYLNWRGDLTIEKDGFNDVDAVILSRLSYLPFDNIVKESLDETITIKEAANLYFSCEQNSGRELWKGDLDLLRAVSKSGRFSQMKLCGFCNMVVDRLEMQFAALVFDMGNSTRFISFRGTDNTVTGWQEDFNMYCMSPVPSQIKAADYLKKASQHFDGSFILGGHSKGGNLAIFAGAFCGSKIQERIKQIYNLDGPGFEKKVWDSEGMLGVRNKIRTLVPQSSIFGMMFEHQEDFVIIKSNQRGFFQHDIYSWEVENNRLVTLHSLTSTSAFFEHTFSEFVTQMNIRDRRELVEGIFTLLKSTEDKTFNEIVAHLSKDAMPILRSIKSMNSKTRLLLISSLMRFIKCAMNNFSDLKPISKIKASDTTEIAPT
ncbi:MAG: Mbeg1-like protein [Ruminococcus sp.]|nr:Mbeg1-like protein [Ruminococcus sp.]